MACLAALSWLQVNRNTLNIPLLVHPHRWDLGASSLGQAQRIRHGRVRDAASPAPPRCYRGHGFTCRIVEGMKQTEEEGVKGSGGGSAFTAQEKSSL